MEASAVPGNRRPRYGALVSGALLAGALAYVGLVDPHRPGSVFPLCPFRLLTGWNCPACGGLRMTHDLLHGDLAAAVMDNVFLLIGIPVLAAWILLRRRRGQAVSPIPTLAVIAVATITWTLLRNLPGFPLVPSVLTG
ncbi:MAG: DUF2752 domain-containing protein [Mycobacterium sp.]